MGGLSSEPVLAVKERPAVKVGVADVRTRLHRYRQCIGFNTPQTPGRPITWTGGFYFRVSLPLTVDFKTFWATCGQQKIEFTSVKL